MRGRGKVAVFTGSRAEYGLLRHLIKAIDANQAVTLQLIVSGSHLSQRYGSTVMEIEADDIAIASRVPLSLDTKTMPTMPTLTAEAIEGIGKALEKLQPDLLVLLGDRYEAFAAATAAHLQGISVVHLHGGESTEGAMDDRLRHAISQLSTWHFTSAETYRQRVIAMGHPPDQVFNIGPMVLDALVTAPKADRSDFEQTTGFQFAEKNLLVTYHSETLLPDLGTAGFSALLAALEDVSCNILFTHPNADKGSDKLIQQLQDFVGQHSDRAWSLPSLGQKLYLDALQLFDAMAGNSSSGVIEAPLVNMPVVNIGHRQTGRLRHGEVHDVPAVTKSIVNGLKEVLNEGQRTEWPRSKPLLTQTPTQFILTWIESLAEI